MIHFHRNNALRIVGTAIVLMAGAQARASEVDDLRTQLEAMKSEYQSRIQALESRLAQLEAQTPAAPPVTAAAPVAPAPSGGGSNAANAFNPAVAVILGGRYTQTSADPSSYAIAGFIPAGDAVGPGPRSFTLDESELTLAANIDPYFFGNLTASISGENTISVEEAYVRTLALPDGLLAKGGRFFSGIGYLNEVHAHAWDFVDQPLIYQAMFNGQLAQNGLQVKWLAPTDMFMEIGAEAGNGQEYPGTRLHGNGLNGAALLAHVGDDVGDSISWRAGLSWLSQQAENRDFDDMTGNGAPVRDAFSGATKTWVADAILKWSPHGNANVRSFKLQAEYMQRTEDGRLTFDATGQNLTGGYHARQSGWYLQGVYQFMPRWRFGARYDLLDSGAVNIGLVEQNLLPASAFTALVPHTPSRLTAMFDWNPSEFSRLRLQYAWDRARLDEHDQQLMLQYLYSIGAHGAHKF